MNYWKILKDFGTEQEYIHLLEELRWGDKRICPDCSSCMVWKQKKRQRGIRTQWICRECYRYYTVTAGTVFHGSRLKLQSWFEILYYTYGVDKELSSWKIGQLIGSNLQTVRHIRDKIKNQSEGMLLKKIFRLSE